MAATIPKETEEETRAYIQEFEWLLSQEVPSVCLRLGQLLKKCIEKFDEAPAAPSAASRARSSPDVNSARGKSPIICPEGSLKGSLKMEGTKVVQGDITYALPASITQNNARYNKGDSFRAQIVTDRPWAIPQAQTLANCLRLALVELETSLQQQGPHLTKPDVTALLSKVTGHLQKAKEVCSVGTIPSIESRMGIISVLSPAPPPELLVDMYLSKLRLTVRACTVICLVNPPSMKTSHGEPDSVGFIFPSKDKWYEVTEISEGTVDVAFLTDTFADIHALLELSQRTLDKLNAFVGNPRFFQR